MAQAVQAPSFTATSFTSASLIPARPADFPGKATKKKGHVKIRTSLGDINVELHCGIFTNKPESNLYIVIYLFEILYQRRAKILFCYAMRVIIIIQFFTGIVVSRCAIA